MIPTSQVYRVCSNLFKTYPLAVSVVNHVPGMHSMVLMLRDHDEVRFFVLLRVGAGSRPAYMLNQWRGDDTVEIAADGGEVPALAVDAVMRGVPIPRDGAMFGWSCQETVTALVVAYARYTREWPMPTWSVMPLVGISEPQWPPFTDERLWGSWFWEYYQAGNVIYLGSLIAANPGTVFWADTYGILGSDCCVVECDIKTVGGHILRSGNYLDATVLRESGARPLLDGLLAEASRTDLAPRFEASAPGNG